MSFLSDLYRRQNGVKSESSRRRQNLNNRTLLGQQADKKQDGDVRNGNEMVMGMKAK